MLSHLLNRVKIPIGPEAGRISKIRLRFAKVKPVKHNIGEK
jgi:hypothetical protein